MVLILHFAAIAVTLAVVTSLAALVTSPREGACMTGSVLMTWAIVDMRHPIIGQHLVSSTFHQLMVFVRMPPGEANVEVEAAAQKMASAQAESAAMAIARSQGKASQAPGNTRISQVELAVTERVQRPSVTVGEEDTREVNFRVVHDSHSAAVEQFGALQDELESEMLDDVRQDAEPQNADLHFVEADFSNPVRRRCCLSCAVLALPVLMCLYLYTIYQMSWNPIVVFLAVLVAVSGVAYWAAAFVLMIAVVMVGPQACEPRRGPDGFYIVRSLSQQEREALPSRQASGPGHSP